MLGASAVIRHLLTCSARLHRNRTNIAASRGCSECRETPKPDPPKVAAILAAPLGRGAISKRSLIRQLGARSAIYSLAQLRRNAAFPACHRFPASHSLYATTSGGEMEPTQRAALSHARMFCGLFIVTLPFSSSIVPPPSDTCHSSALQVRASEGAPSQTKPQKSLFPFARSPDWIRFAMTSSSSHVFGGARYPFFRSRSTR